MYMYKNVYLIFYNGDFCRLDILYTQYISLQCIIEIDINDI